VLIAELELSQGTAGFNHWQLWERSRASNPPWIALKLISVRKRMHKANYWLAWNSQAQRFARVRDQGTLINYDPSAKTLVRWMERELVKRFAAPSTVRLVKRGR
jgi:hypothetical protein